MLSFAVFARRFIGICNLVIILIAIIAGVCAYCIFEKNQWVAMLSNLPPCQLLICAIVFMICASLVGFLLMFLKQRWIRILYTSCIFIVILVEISASAVTYTYSGKIFEQLKIKWPKESNLSGKCENTFDCCGFDGAYRFDPTTSETICDAPDYPEQNKTDCYQKLSSSIKKNITSLGVAISIMLIFELLLFIFATYLAFCWHPEKDSSKFEEIY